MRAHNDRIYVQPDPTDRWTVSSDILSEMLPELCNELGYESLPGTSPSGQQDAVSALREFILDCAAENVLDAIEMTSGSISSESRAPFEAKINKILELDECPWRLWEGEFFKLDDDFVGARSVENTLKNLSAGRFAGAADEYAKAQREQASGEVKDAIADACKSYESVLKVLVGQRHSNADRLTKLFNEQGYLDDLPEDIREGFRGVILMSLPSLRNKIAAHGQGISVVEISASYGLLALQLAAALNNFLVAKHFERSPTRVEETPPRDDIVFSRDIHE